MKFDGLEPRCCEDIKAIVVPEIDPKSFGTFEKQAPDQVDYDESNMVPLYPDINMQWRLIPNTKRLGTWTL